MIESLLILNILTLGIVGGLLYFYIQSVHNEQREKIETITTFYEKIITSLQSEKVHLYNCFLDKHKQLPLGIDHLAERQQRIDELKQKKEETIIHPVKSSPIADAQRQAQLNHANGK